MNNKRSSTKKVVALIIAVCFIFSFSVSAVRAQSKVSDAVTLKLFLLKQIITVDGVSAAAPSFIKQNNTYYVPIKSVIEAVGGDLTKTGSDNFSIKYRNFYASIKLNANDYKLNNKSKKLSVPPILNKKVLMTPLKFLEDFLQIKANIDTNKGEITLKLTNDGAIDDLTFLTGSLTKPLIGNSYFNWNIAVPKGSRLANVSYNSRFVRVENEQRGISLEVNVSINKGKSFKQFYDSVKQDIGQYIDGEVASSSVSNTTNPYAEFLYTNSFEESAIRRYYVKDSYIYSVSLYSAFETDPKRMLSTKYYKGILDSFTMSYSKSAAAMDTSNISGGKVKYDNYISTESGKKYLSWQMEVPPQWDIQDNSSNPFYREIGNENGDYVSIEMLKADNRTADGYSTETKNYYNKIFNPALYELNSSSNTSINGLKCSNLNIALTFGKSKYIYDEYIFEQKGIIYDITFKTTFDKYSQNKMLSEQILNSFSIMPNDNPVLIQDIEKYNFTQEKNVVGKDDTLTYIENIAQGWGIKVPGNWVRNPNTGSSLQSFTDNKTGLAVMLEIIEKKTDEKPHKDEEKFSLMSSVIKEGEKLEKQPDSTHQGFNAKIYTSRYVSEDDEYYANERFYVIETEKFSYCMMTELPDICASPANIKLMGDIWDSFVIGLTLTDKK